MVEIYSNTNKKAKPIMATITASDKQKLIINKYKPRKRGK